MCHSVVVDEERHKERERPRAGYHDRARSREEHFPGSWHRCGWAPRRSQGVAPAQVLPFFESLAPCLIGMEACSSAHHWARELSACGHTVKLMPPSYVKPYVKRGKNDAADAEAICEAVTRPTMRFVPVKAPEQQAAVMLHRTRALLMRQRIMVVNALRGHLAEFGLIAPQGAKGLADLLERSFRPDGTGRLHGTGRHVAPSWRCRTAG